jgi:hypothetical protein
VTTVSDGVECFWPSNPFLLLYTLHYFAISSHSAFLSFVVFLLILLEEPFRPKTPVTALVYDVLNSPSHSSRYCLLVKVNRRRRRGAGAGEVNEFALFRGKLHSPRASPLAARLPGAFEVAASRLRVFAEC